MSKICPNAEGCKEGGDMSKICSDAKDCLSHKCRHKGKHKPFEDCGERCQSMRLHGTCIEYVEPPPACPEKHCSKGHTLPITVKVCRDDNCKDIFLNGPGACIHLKEQPKEQHAKQVICVNYKDGKCTKELDPEELETAWCAQCGKPSGTCVLLCDCEEETCNIGELCELGQQPEPQMPLRQNCNHSGVCKYDDTLCALECGYYQPRMDMESHDAAIASAAVKAFAEKVIAGRNLYVPIDKALMERIKIIREHDSEYIGTPSELEDELVTALQVHLRVAKEGI